jgi:hypothetical protein
MIKPIELGCAGHLIVANSCRWKRHTQVGKYRISSIGDYYAPDLDKLTRDPRAVKRTTIGAGPDAWFETMVFETTDEQEPGNEGCGCHQIKSWGEIDSERYATAGEAQTGHERYVAKYLALQLQ